MTMEERGNNRSESGKEVRSDSAVALDVDVVGDAPIAFSRRKFVGACAALMVVRAAGEPPPKRTVAVMFDSLISPGWVESRRVMRVEAERRGWSLIETVSNMDDHKQYQQLQSMIQRGVDGVVMIHTDDKAVVPAVRAANAAGIPLVHFNRPPAPNDAYSVAVVADNRSIMRDTVTALIEIARQQGGTYKAAILVGDLGDANAVQRRDGFEDAVSQHSDIVEVVSRIATEWNADKAFAGLTNALQAHPDINMLVTSSDFLTPQIEQAFKAAGKWHKAGEPGHVLIAGFDGDENGYEQLAAGYYDVDGVQNLGQEVVMSFDSLAQMWQGEKPPKLIIDEGFVISRDTLLEKREQMWGYQIWKQKKAALAAAGSAAGAESTSISGAAIPAEAGGEGSGLLAWLAAGGLLVFAQTFLSWGSMGDILLAMIPLAVLVTGQTLVLLIGQIDLSMTAVMAFGSVAGASFMTRAGANPDSLLNTAGGVTTCLTVGLLVGLFNGLCVAFLRIPSFIATLAVMMGLSGAAVWFASSVSDTISIGGLPELFRGIGYGKIMGVPYAFILAGLVLGLAWFTLKRTMMGRWLYAIGHNHRAARVSGVPVRSVTVAAFAISGLCAAIACIIMTSRIETGLPTLGRGMLLDVVGAAVIGGVSLFGGRGGVLWAMGGVALLCILDKSLQLLGLSLFLVLSIKGLAILAAAIADALRRRKGGET